MSTLDNQDYAETELEGAIIQAVLSSSDKAKAIAAVNTALLRLNVLSVTLGVPVLTILNIYEESKKCFLLGVEESKQLFDFKETLN